MAKYLSSLIQKMSSAPALLYLQPGENTNLPISQNPPRGALAGRAAQLLPRISLLCSECHQDWKIPFYPMQWLRNSHPIQFVAGSQGCFGGRNGSGTGSTFPSPKLWLVAGEGSSLGMLLELGMLLGLGMLPTGHLRNPQPRCRFVNVINLEVLLLPQVQLTSPSANP